GSRTGRCGWITSFLRSASRRRSGRSLPPLWWGWGCSFGGDTGESRLAAACRLVLPPCVWVVWNGGVVRLGGALGTLLGPGRTTLLCVGVLFRVPVMAGSAYRLPVVVVSGVGCGRGLVVGLRITQWTRAS